jgi:alkylhydroperoxidase family enzyme
MNRISLGLAAAALLMPASAPADDAPIVPATRPEMKRILEGSKHSVPRLPLPAPTAAEVAQASNRPKGTFSGIVNNARMRGIYLPAELRNASYLGAGDPSQTLDDAFKVELFWIVSRINNCYYCMGHQETKLAAAGRTEDRVASLDGDWSGHTPAERVAYAYAKKLSREPQSVTDADIAALKRHYTDAQVLEMTMAVGGFNGMNRWTGALAIPQEEHRVYLSPTSPSIAERVSLVAPIDASEGKPQAPVCAVPAARPRLETAGELAAALAAARTRVPRLVLAGEEVARAALPADFPSSPLPAWVRLLARFPKTGVGRVVLHRAAEEAGTLDPRLKAEVAYIAARNDRAWYALDQADRRLKALGATPAEVAELDGPWDALPPARKHAYELARKLTVDPALVGDADIARLRGPYTDKQVAELVFQVTEAAFFDRLTEAAGLPLEP